jgi:hypothetical protein
MVVDVKNSVLARWTRPALVLRELWKLALSLHFVLSGHSAGLGPTNLPAPLKTNSWCSGKPFDHENILQLPSGQTCSL